MTAENGDRRPVFRALTLPHLDALLSRAGLDRHDRLRARAVAEVLPFRTNSYVVDELIDWDRAPDDPIYRLVFPQPDMLPKADVDRIAALLAQGAPPARLLEEAREVRMRLNPHPGGQRVFNTPLMDGLPIEGMQHKYPETVLFFPRQGQTCHAYCTYCFRWPQFVGEPDLRMASGDATALREYVLAHPEVTSVLITGGDPLIMSSTVLARYVEPLLDVPHLESVRIGTKALSYWPHRVLTDPDSDDLLRLFERVVRSGRNLALMGHYSHPRELGTGAAERALRRVRETGAVVRCQAPLIRGVNDRAEDWADLWRKLVALGAVPYYMFVERDTGPQDYFAVPLARAYEIFREAYAQVSGLARTVRGPIMSATPGKVQVDGVTEVNGQRAFVLHYVQARDPELVGRPFFAAYDPDARWLTDLKPLAGDGALPGVD
ncbi:KamA family radical SAM protein [Kitasatospora atroaurantiaca]|uniref:L-lysine 2,3-aminomutase n=1 Tax=Kitasatospora atroaurantiaca TaxID=285545 RepID=A0A561EXF9_9ACTN|nr:lysine 2,3-aminomutase [Kitasatospora atroaurantiaca]TWE20291.1 L-lysine 2,3-aminomutase [Kitasatospora atroaurantiaca]